MAERMRLVEQMPKSVVNAPNGLERDVLLSETANNEKVDQIEERQRMPAVDDWQIRMQKAIPPIRP